MFLGVSFSGTDSSSSSSAISNSTITTFKISHIVLDELYATSNVLLHFNWQIPDTWTFDTMLHAQYRGDTYAGNVNFTADIVDRVKIKKRYVGDFTWKTIYEQEISSIDDLVIDIWDYYEPSNRDIEYSYVAVIGGVDANTISASVRSEFEHYFICDRNVSYPMVIDADNKITYNRESSTLVSPGRKYPYVINNGIAKYYSGTMTVTFIEIKDCELDVANGWKYRNQIDEWLTNGEAKILKSFEGDMWMVNIVGSIPRTVHDHYQYVSHQIDWVECGNPVLIGDLHDHGFIDTDTDRE